MGQKFQVKILQTHEHIKKISSFIKVRVRIHQINGIFSMFSFWIAIYTAAINRWKSVGAEKTKFKATAIISFALDNRKTDEISQKKEKFIFNFVDTADRSVLKTC